MPLLEGFLPRVLPSLEFLCVAHEGKQDLEKSIFQKVSGARLMAEHLTEEANRSRSFQVFMSGLRRVAAALSAE
jgi:hypothetical protein